MWQAISREDYETVLWDLGYSESEIEEELSAHPDEERVEARTLSREKHISGEFYLTGQVTVYAWRDASGELTQKVSAMRVDSLTLTGYDVEEWKGKSVSEQTGHLSINLAQQLAEGFCGSAEMSDLSRGEENVTGFAAGWFAWTVVLRTGLTVCADGEPRGEEDSWDAEKRAVSAGLLALLGFWEAHI